MKKFKSVSCIILFVLLSFCAMGQNGLDINVFENQPINYNGKTGNDPEAKKLHHGRLIYKKISVPEFVKGTDVKLTLTLVSAGDRWDKSGSCFVVSDPEKLSIVNISEGKNDFPVDSGISGGFSGIRATPDYEPVVELLRFITPYGVGLENDSITKHRKPVYIPQWENEIRWEVDISHLLELVENTFYIGVWIDTWTKEGYKFDLQLHYSNRPDNRIKTRSLVNSVYYVQGQSLPEFYASTDLEQQFSFVKKANNVKLHYITTGHGGHTNGDEFSKKANRIWVDDQLVLDFIPWRDDCASFRRYNPTSGVWLKKDSASYIDFKDRAYKVKEIEERIASSDLSRANWCPGSAIEPVIVNLGDMEAGTHQLKISIDAAPADEDKYNHWLTSVYLTFED